jgi:nucleoside-diphosphate-sugar epimerase
MRTLVTGVSGYVGAALAPRLREPRVRPWVFLASTMALGLALRIALGAARAAPARGGEGGAIPEVYEAEVRNEDSRQ